MAAKAHAKGHTVAITNRGTVPLWLVKIGAAGKQTIPGAKTLRVQVGAQRYLLEKAIAVTPDDVLVLVEHIANVYPDNGVVVLAPLVTSTPVGKPKPVKLAAGQAAEIAVGKYRWVVELGGA